MQQATKRMCRVGAKGNLYRVDICHLFVKNVNEKYEPNCQSHTQIAQHVDTEHKELEWKHVAMSYGCTGPWTNVIKVLYQNLQIRIDLHISQQMKHSNEYVQTPRTYFAFSTIHSSSWSIAPNLFVPKPSLIRHFFVSDSFH